MFFWIVLLVAGFLNFQYLQLRQLWLLLGVFLLWKVIEYSGVLKRFKKEVKVLPPPPLGSSPQKSTPRPVEQTKKPAGPGLAAKLVAKLKGLLSRQKKTVDKSNLNGAKKPLKFSAPKEFFKEKAKKS